MSAADVGYDGAFFMQDVKDFCEAAKFVQVRADSHQLFSRVMNSNTDSVSTWDLETHLDCNITARLYRAGRIHLRRCRGVELRVESVVHSLRGEQVGQRTGVRGLVASPICRDCIANSRSCRHRFRWPPPTVGCFYSSLRLQEERGELITFTNAHV